MLHPILLQKNNTPPATAATTARPPRDHHRDRRDHHATITRPSRDRRDHPQFMIFIKLRVFCKNFTNFVLFFASFCKKTLNFDILCFLQKFTQILQVLWVFAGICTNTVSYGKYCAFCKNLHKFYKYCAFSQEFAQIL